MSDLIDRRKLLEEITSEQNLRADSLMSEWYADMVKRQPKVDAVQVVRCKDCKFWGSCLSPDNGYCNDGEYEEGDAVPVVHGHWKFGCGGSYNGILQVDLWDCSNCGESCGYKTKYCPYCGAKMDEDGEKND